MRRLVLAPLAAALLLGSAVPATAEPTRALEPTLPADLTHAKTSNIDYLGRFPEHTGTAGGLLGDDGKRFYITDPRGVYVYDTTNPASPDLLGSLPLYQHATGTGAALAQEDPDTNGKILLVDGSATPNGSVVLNVVDVSNPASMRVLDTVATTDHTWTCVSGTDATGAANSCAFAYGRSGAIIDLTNPADAKLSSGNWKTQAQYTGYVHDLTEVRAGLVMASGGQGVLLDTRNPRTVKKLALLGENARFSSLGYHSIEWANGGTDPYVIGGTEITPAPFNGAGAGSDCEGPNAVVETWDAREIVAGLDAYYGPDQVPASIAFKNRAFRKIDAFDAGSRGVFVQGQSPGNVLYCAHWMELNPDFDGQGLVAISYYDRGTRFVKVGADGKMTEVGWMTAAEGYSGSVQWISRDIAYVMDYRRGMEVLRIRNTPATGVQSSSPDAIAVGSGFVPPSALTPALASNVALGVAGLAFGGLRLQRRKVARGA